MIPPANIILAAAGAGYVDRAWWTAWADRQLLAISGPAPIWLVNLSLAESIDEVRQALEPRLDAELPLQISRTSLIVGFVFCASQDGRTTLCDALERIGEEVDAGFVDGLDPEDVYACLHESEDPTARPTDSMVSLIERLSQLALEARRALSSVAECGHDALV